MIGWRIHTFAVHSRVLWLNIGLARVQLAKLGFRLKWHTCAPISQGINMGSVEKSWSHRKTQSAVFIMFMHWIAPRHVGLSTVEWWYHWKRFAYGGSLQSNSFVLPPPLFAEIRWKEIYGNDIASKTYGLCQVCEFANHGICDRWMELFVLFVWSLVFDVSTTQKERKRIHICFAL